MASDKKASVADAFDSGEGGAEAPPNLLAKMQEELDKMKELHALIQNMEDDLSATKEAYTELRTKVLPDIMTQIGTPEYVHNGMRFTLEDFVSGSLPKDEEAKKAALKWLTDNEGEALIKTEVTTKFGKSEHQEALALEAFLRDEGYEPTTFNGVHAQSLQAFARERLKNGDPLDAEALGLFVGRIVKAKEVKAK